MEEIEYLEEYEEIVMPQLFHNSIQEFLPTDDPYDLLPVDPAFDEFIEEDPLCSVYRNDFEFETTQANDSGNRGDTNISATGAITTLSPSVTNSIVTVSAGDSVSSTIVTGDVNEDGNMIIVHPGIQTTTTTTLINVQSNSGNHQLEYIPTEIVETTVTYDNNQQQNNIDNNDDDNEAITEIQNNNNENNIIYSNSYVTTSSPTTITHHDNNGIIGSGVKVLSCETLGTSAFLNVSGTTILTQSHLPITPIKQKSTIIDSPLNADAGNNRLIGTTSEYIRATHSSNNSINTNLSLLGLPLSPPALQYQQSSSTPISLHHQQTGNVLHHHYIHQQQQQQYNSPLSSSIITNLQNYPPIIATSTTNRSKKSLSSILYNKNNDFYPQLLALNSGLKKQKKLSDKFKSLFKNNNNENIKNSGFGKLKEYPMKKSNYRLKMNKSEMIAIRASTFKKENLNFLYRSKEIQLPKPFLKSIHQQQYNKQISNIDNDDNNEISTKMIIEKIIPIIPTKGAVKQYEVIEKTQQINDNNIHDSDEESLTTNNEQDELNEEYINDDDTAILNDIDGGDILTTSNPIDINNGVKISISNKEEKKEDDLKNTKYNLPSKSTNYKQSSYKIPLNDSDIISTKRSDMISKFSKSMESLHNNNATVLKIDKKLDTDLIIAKNTSLKIRQSKSLIPLKDSGNNGGSSNKFRNMMKSKFSKSMENITKCLRDEQKIKQNSATGGEDDYNNEIKAISVGGYKKSNFGKLCKKSNVATTTTVMTTNDNNNKIDAKHYNKHDKILSPIRTNKSKSQTINDVLNSPKVLRVVIPRTLEQTSTIKKIFSMNNKLKDNTKSNISPPTSSSSDLNGIKEIYKNDDEQQKQQQQREFVDPIKITDIDPLQLDNDVDDDEIISHLQNVDNNKIEKSSKNNDQNDYNKSSTPIDEFELFAKQQKLIKTIMNTDKKYLERCRSGESSESPILFPNNIQSSPTKSTTTLKKEDENSCSSKLMMKDVANKLNDNKINKSNDLKTTIINCDNLNEKTNNNDGSGKSLKRNSKSMNRNSKSSTMIEENNVKLKEHENIKHFVKDKEIINKNPPEILTKTSSDQEKIQENSTTVSTTTTKSKLTTTKKSSDEEKIQETSITTAATMSTKPQILTLMNKFSSNQEKLQKPQAITASTTTRKHALKTILTYNEKSSIEENIQEAPTTSTNAKPDTLTLTKKSANREKIQGEIVGPNKPEILILAKTTPSQEKIAETVTATKSSIIKPLTKKTSNQDEKIITSAATIQEKPAFEHNKSFDITNTTTTFELVRSKRIASRNQSSTDSHPSSLKEISFDNKDHIEPISHSVSKSKIRNSRSSSSSDQLKTVNTSPKIDTKSIQIMKPRSRDLKNLKTDKDNQEANSMSKRSASKSRHHQINKIEETKKDIPNTRKENDSVKNVAVSEMKIDDNKSTKIDDNDLCEKNITSQILHFPHLNRRRAITDEGTKNEIKQLIGINNDSSLKQIEPLEASIKSAQQIGVVSKDHNNQHKLDDITLISGKDNKNLKLIDKDIHKNSKEKKKPVAKEEDNNAKTNEQQKNKKDNVKDIENIDMKMSNKKDQNIEETCKKDSENLTTFKKPTETSSVTGGDIEPKQQIQQQPVSDKEKEQSDKEKEAELKAIRRRNRELKLLEIDNKLQHIFIEPTMTGLRTRSKRRTDSNPIQIATKKPVAKIICRRRQSNLIQISRKEYDRVVNERRAAAAEDANKKQQESTTQSPPILIPYHVDTEQQENFSKVLEYEKEYLKKNNIKKCKVVLESTSLTYKNPKKLKKLEKLTSSTTKIIEKNKDLVTEMPKVIEDSAITINKSNQTMNIYDSNTSPTIAKKRKLNIGVEQEVVSEPKITKKSDDLHLEPENTESLPTEKINHPEEVCTTNLILSKPSNDNSTKNHSAPYDKLNKSELTPTIDLPKLDKTISQATIKNKQPPTTTKLMEPTSKNKNKSTMFESIVTTEATTTDSPKVLEELSKKTEITKTNKSNEKIRISSRFLPLKMDSNNKDDKDCSRTSSLKRYKSTPNLNLVNDNANIENNNKLTNEKTTTTSQNIIDFNRVATRCLRNKESTNLSITHKEPEPTTTATKNISNSKRKLSESQLISDGGDDESKKQKLSSNDKKSTITEEEESLKNLTEIIELRKEDNQLNEIGEITNSSNSPIVQQNHIISKPQIFIAAPENISRRRNSESNVGDNNNEKNSTVSGLDFSIESWFQDIPPPNDIDNVEMETSTISTDIIPELNEILTSTTNSADENDDIVVEPVVSITPVLPKTTSQKSNSQLFNSMTKTKKYWPLKPNQQQQTQLQTTSTPQITCTPDISSYSIATEPATFNIPNIKSINIPAHIVVQTKFLTREQYMSKLRKNPINVSSTTNATAAATNALIQNTLISGNNVSSSSTGIGNKNSSDQRSSAKILERISDLLETHIDTEVKRKLKDLIENKTAEDNLRTERLANINKIGYTSDFGLQMLVFLQNYFFNTPTVMGNIRNIGNIRDNSNSSDSGSINTRNIEKQLPIKSPNISGIEDFSFRRIRLPPVQSINNNNNLQQKLPNRTALQSNLNTNNSPIMQNKYPTSGIINIGSNNVPLQNNSRLPNISLNNTLNDGGHISLTLRQSTTGQGAETNTEVFLNSTNNTCEAAITNEPESILPDDNQIIAAPQLLDSEIKEETIEESIIS